MKTCFKCAEVKPLAEFYRHREMADGRLGKCKACAKADVAKHRSDNIEKVREYDRTRATQPHRVALNVATTRRFRAENPAAASAHKVVAKAVRLGDLQRWPCEICGGKSHAHHPHYDAPLMVVWLCAAHHKAAHAVTNTESEQLR
jgi:hypothetical protein